MPIKGRNDHDASVRDVDQMDEVKQLNYINVGLGLERPFAIVTKIHLGGI